MMAGLIAGALWLAPGAPGRANAFEAAQAFAKGTKILGLQVNGGVQNNIQDEPTTSGLDFIGFQPRFSYLPFEPFGSSWYAAAIEPGVEGWVQYYMHPDTSVAGGMKASLRLHAIGLGPVIPISKGRRAWADQWMSGESLEVHLLFRGGRRLDLRGARVALNGGYRLQHFSNANTSRPNRGYNAHTGLVGVSFFLH